MECVLSEVQPNYVKNPRGLWTKQATDIISNLVLKKPVYGKVNMNFFMYGLDLIYFF